MRRQSRLENELEHLCQATRKRISGKKVELPHIHMINAWNSFQEQQPRTIKGKAYSQDEEFTPSVDPVVVTAVIASHLVSRIYPDGGVQSTLCMLIASNNYLNI